MHSGAMKYVDGCRLFKKCKHTQVHILEVDGAGKSDGAIKVVSKMLP